MSKVLALWVIVPTEILLIPVLEIFFMSLKLALPEYSVSYFLLQSLRHFFNWEILILSKRILLNFNPNIFLNCPMFSISTVTTFLDLEALVTSFFKSLAALIWLSLIKTSSLRLYLWLKPPPFLTAYFSNNLRLGVVFLVQQIFVFFPAFSTKLFVIVAIPDAWFKKFKAVLSAVSIVFVFAKISAITLFFFYKFSIFHFRLKNWLFSN